jgi:hypothetical protein
MQTRYLPTFLIILLIKILTVRYSTVPVTKTVFCFVLVSRMTISKWRLWYLRFLRYKDIRLEYTTSVLFRVSDPH